MKVLITAAQFSSSISGLQRHALNMVRSLLTQSSISAVHFALAPWQHELMQAVSLSSIDRVTTHVVDMDQSLSSRNLWYYRRLPELAAQIRPDVVHLSYPVPVKASAISCPIVLTLHDLYPYEIPENFGFPKVIFNRLILQQCLRNVDAIACVSDTTVLRMKQYVSRGIWRKAIRIYNCVETEEHYTQYSPLPEWQGEPFLLTVSQHRKNKNIQFLVRVFHRLLREGSVDPEMKLFVIGITGPETARIHQLVSDLGLDQRVVFLQGLPEPVLQWCYAHCKVLVAPSATEGFGLPVAEAMLAGCHIVCSDIPAFREIDEGHCRFVALGPGAEEKFAGAILACLQEPPKSQISLPQFSTSVVGTQYANLYHGLLSSVSSLGSAANAASVQRLRSNGSRYDGELQPQIAGKGERE
jgi:glycosyltransferase involved in cell wall biosynthesis